MKRYPGMMQKSLFQSLTGSQAEPLAFPQKPSGNMQQEAAEKTRNIQVAIILTDLHGMVPTAGVKPTK